MNIIIPKCWNVKPIEYITGLYFGFKVKIITN